MSNDTGGTDAHPEQKRLLLLEMAVACCLLIISEAVAWAISRFIHPGPRWLDPTFYVLVLTLHIGVAANLLEGHFPTSNAVKVPQLFCNGTLLSWLLFHRPEAPLWAVVGHVLAEWMALCWSMGAVALSIARRRDPQRRKARPLFASRRSGRPWWKNPDGVLVGLLVIAVWGGILVTSGPLNPSPTVVAEAWAALLVILPGGAILGQVLSRSGRSSPKDAESSQ